MTDSEENFKEQVVIYDDSCRVCSYAISVLDTESSRKKVKFIRRSSKDALNFISNHPGLPDSVICIKDQQITTKSDAVFTLLKQQGGLIRIFLIFRFLPLAFQNRLYDFIAHHRQFLSRILLLRRRISK